MKTKLIVLLLSLSTLSWGQDLPVVGDWQGILSGTALKLILHVKSTGEKLATTLDSPTQGAFGLVCDKTEFDGSQLTVSLSMAGASFVGKLIDGELHGEWNQRGNSIGLNLKRMTGNEKAEVKPQTPKPPFAYHSDEVEYDNADQSLHYGATLTYPNGNGPFPAAILITGSGMQDRDETIGLHKSFAVIADYLTKKGMVVIRVDDRGVGKSTGNFQASTSEDFEKDVEVTLHYLQSRKEVNIRKIGLIGHSEGGMIGPMVAAKNKAIAFVVMLAGPGIPITELMSEQSAALLRGSGIPASTVDQYLALYRKLAQVIPAAASQEEAGKTAMETFQTWQKKTDAEIVKATTAVTDSASAQKFVTRFTEQVYSPWFRYFLRYNPQVALRQVKCPVLALNGEKDVQVIAKSNLAGIQASLGKNKKNKIQELPGLNHLFQTCTTCMPSEYFTLEETISPTALDVMGTWITEVVK